MQIILIIFMFFFSCARAPEQNKPAPTFERSYDVGLLYGIFQAKYTDSSTSEREFTAGNGYILRDYNSCSRLIHTVYGKWTELPDSKLNITVDSAFMVNPCTFQRSADLNSVKSFILTFKDLSTSAIGFFCAPTDSSPADWECWKKLL